MNSETTFKSQSFSKYNTYMWDLLIMDSWALLQGNFGLFKPNLGKQNLVVYFTLLQYQQKKGAKFNLGSILDIAN